MIGASLYNGSYYSDPPNDRKITVPSGSSTGSRIFVIPSGIPSGTYDLLVALWFDVDENNAINSGDFMMYMVSEPSLINVCLTSVDEEISNLTKNGGKVYSVDGKRVEEIKSKGVYFIIKDGKVKKVIKR